MKQSENLLAHYKPTITPQYKSVEDMQKWLESHLDVEEISLTEFSDAFIEHLNYNSTNAITNSDLQLTAEDFLFVAYRIMHTEKNKEYNADLQKTNDNYIHVIFEKKTECFFTNNSKLFLELSIEQGISQYDYENDTIRLLHYVSCIDRLAKFEY